MTAIAAIVDDLKRGLDGESWHGPSIAAILGGITATHAAAHPVTGAHSIWELVHHVTVWVRTVHARVLGRVAEPEGEADWPPVRETSERAWTAALDDLRRAQVELIAALQKLSDADLDGPVPNRDYDRGHLLRGLSQHHAYHAGQMSLLKRAVNATDAG